MTNTAPPKWRQFLGALTLLHVLALGGQALEARAQEPAPPDPPEAAPSEEGAALSYDVAFDGLDDKPELTALLSKTALLFTLQDRGVETLGALRRRAEGDAPRLKQALNSEGYFGATLNYRLDEPADGPPKVTIKVTPGTRYTLGEYRVINRTPEAETGILTPDLGSLGLDLGQPARGPEIAAAQNKLIRRLNEGGFPDAQVVDRKAYVDHDKKELYIDLTIESGLAARLGEARFELDGSVGKDTDAGDFTLTASGPSLAALSGDLPELPFEASLSGSLEPGHIALDPFEASFGDSDLAGS
ncbi:MAG: hypothetical protein P8X52_02660, partial [Limibacillus sp.]